MNAADSDIIDTADAITAVNEKLGDKKYEEALTMLNSDLKKHPDFNQFNLQKGFVQLRLKQYDEAIVSLNHCLTAGYGGGIGQKAVDSLNAELWIYLGHCKLAKGDKAGAEEAFKKGFTLYPKLETEMQMLVKIAPGSALAKTIADRLELVESAQKLLNSN